MSATEFLTILLNLWLVAICIIDGSRGFAYIMLAFYLVLNIIQLFFK